MIAIIGVVLIAVILCAVIYQIPGIPQPINWVLPVIILLVAAVLVAQKAGVI